MMKYKPYMYEHFAIGLSRVKAAVAMCDLPPIEKGTFYSKRFKPDGKVELKTPMGINVFSAN